MAYYFSPLGNGVAFVDSNGNPLSGAKLFTYTAGSTTKSTVYQTNAGTAHANPMTLDANGRPPAAIWLEGGRSYKFVLAPSTDTDPPASAIYTWDNVSGINDTAISVDQWVSGPTPTFVDADTFTLVGDQSSTFHVNRRLKLTVSGGTRYGYVSAVAYTTLTTVDVVLDSGTLDSGLSAVSYALLSATNQSYPRNIATTDTAQTITATKTFQSSDAGDSAGPELILDRNSASPAVSDRLGQIPFQGRDSGGNTETYAAIVAEIQDPTAASEDGRLIFRSVTAGTLADQAFLGPGLQMGAPTGGDKGSGTINVATEIYKNNVPVASIAANTFTADQTIQSTDAGAGAGPNLILDRNSASPAAADNLGQLIFRGRDSVGNTESYAVIYTSVVDPTHLSEDAQLVFQTEVGSVTADRMLLGAGLVVGTGATGGDKGAGTINVSGDIYKNNTAYANPDYAFEHYYTGQIVKFIDNPGASDYPGLMPLDDLEKYTRQNFRLPRVSQARGIFDRGDAVLEKLEEAYLHIIELHKRIKALEGR